MKKIWNVKFDGDWKVVGPNVSFSARSVTDANVKADFLNRNQMEPEINEELLLSIEESPQPTVLPVATLGPVFETFSSRG